MYFMNGLNRVRGVIQHINAKHPVKMAVLRAEVGDSVKVRADVMGRDWSILGELCEVVGKLEAEEREGRGPWAAFETPGTHPHPKP